MITYEWTEELCRRYAEGLRPMAGVDHGRFGARIVAELERQGLPEGAALVDLATGPGFLLVAIGKRLPGLKLIAQDQAAPMLAIAREEAAAAGLTLTTVRCPAEQLSLPDGAVDVVTCKQLLHEADPWAVAVEALRVLKPGGRLFLIDFDADGSRAAALAIRTLLLLTRGLQISRDFWGSFSAGLPGAEVRSMLLAAGFETAGYERAGPNYFITASKPGLPATGAGPAR